MGIFQGRSVPLFICALLFLLLTPRSATPRPREAVSLAVLQYDGRDACYRSWLPTVEYLEARLPDHDFRLRVYNIGEMRERVLAGKLGFVVCDPGLYVELEQTANVNRLATLKIGYAGQSSSHIAGTVFCRADRDDIASLDDLVGGAFVAPRETDLASWRGVWREFAARGIDPYEDFETLRFIDDQMELIASVLSGKADAASICCGVLESLAVENRIDLADFRLLDPCDRPHCEIPFPHTTRRYPYWPIARTENVDLALAERVTECLLSMPEDDPAARACRSAGWVRPCNYSSVRDCLRELSLPPYETAKATGIADRLARFWPALLAVLLLLGTYFVLQSRIGRLEFTLRVARKRSARIERERDKLHAAARRIVAKSHSDAELRADLFRRLSSEIFTPVQGIVGTSAMLEDTDLSAEQKELVELINASSDALRTQIRNIVNYADITRRELTPEPVDFNLQLLVEDVVDGFADRAHDEGKTIVGVIDADLCRLLRGDALRLRRILENLCDNALKFSPTGESVVLNVAPRENRRSDVEIVFEVIDAGAGLDAAAGARVDALFAREKRSAADAPGERGLGLIVCRQFADVLAGRLARRAAPGGGTVFSLVCAFEKQLLRQFKPPPAWRAAKAGA